MDIEIFEEDQHMHNDEADGIPVKRFLYVSRKNSYTDSSIPSLGAGLDCTCDKEDKNPKIRGQNMTFLKIKNFIKWTILNLIMFSYLLITFTIFYHLMEAKQVVFITNFTQQQDQLHGAIQKLNASPKRQNASLTIVLEKLCFYRNASGMR
uniref:Uncharacterized protein n=1 Tax=Acrobeloides nanus TaxID=290746 RepID=A0A914CPA0_9BILA